MLFFKKKGKHSYRKQKLRVGFSHLIALKSYIYCQFFILFIFSVFSVFLLFSMYNQSVSFAKNVNKNSFNVSLNMNGHIEQTSTKSTNVLSFLNEKNIVLGWGESVSPSLTTKIKKNMMISIGIINTKTQTKKEVLKYETIKEFDYSLEDGKEEIVKDGANGEQKVTYLIGTIGNTVVSKVVLGSEIIHQATSKVVHVGTMPEGIDPANITQVQSSARKMLSEYGWQDNQFSCLVLLWDKESGWNAHANNPFSGAYGIPQALPGSKMSSAGADWMHNPITQIRWGLNYISGRYGSPCNAYGHSEGFGWY